MVWEKRVVLHFCHLSAPKSHHRWQHPYKGQAPCLWECCDTKRASREGAQRGAFLILFGKTGDVFPVLLRFVGICFYPIPCITKPLCSQAWEGHALQPGHAGLLTIQRGWCRVIPAASFPRAASKICYLTCSFGTRAELLFGIEIRSSKGRCLGGETFISQLRF